MSEKQTTFRVLLFWLIASVVASGQGTEPLTGKRYQYDISKPGTVFWTDSPLKQAFASLTQTRRVPIWIDRRCNPALEMTHVSQEPLVDCLWELDQSLEDIDVAWSPEVIYVGMNGSANRWATINAAHRDMLTRLDRAQRLRYLNEKTWRWPRLTNPQHLLRELEAEWGTEFAGRERVHHDLWPAAEFSNLPFFVRLELLLAGFELSFDFDETGNPRIRPMPQAPRVARSVKVPDELREKVDDVLQNYPNAALSVDGRKMNASWAAHEHVRRVIAKPKPKKRVRRDRLRYTLVARNQKLGPFLEQLAKQLDMTCEFSPAAKKQYDTMVSFEVKKASLRDLVTAILKETKLKFTLSGDQLKILSAEEQN